MRTYSASSRTSPLLKSDQIPPPLRLSQAPYQGAPGCCNLALLTLTLVSLRSPLELHALAVLNYLQSSLLLPCPPHLALFRFQDSSSSVSSVKPSPVPLPMCFGYQCIKRPAHLRKCFVALVLVPFSPFNRELCEDREADTHRCSPTTWPCKY